MSPQATARPPRVAVVMISAGRPAVLGQMLPTLAAQTVPHRTVLVVPTRDDLPDQVPPEITVLLAGPGISRQRNAGIDSLDDPDLVFFFDDDAVLRHDYLENALTVFAENPAVVGLTGRVLLDGATGSEIGFTEAVEALEGSLREPLDHHWRRTRELYGCNFAYRYPAAPLLRFDERLLSYSWLEDLDFASQLRRFGALANAAPCVIVHRGVKSGGRTRHRQLGYAQVMNPVYMWRKRSFGLAVALRQSVPLVAKNAVLALVSRTPAARRARLGGNLRALHDVARGRIAPERVSLLADAR